MRYIYKYSFLLFLSFCVCVCVAKAQDSFKKGYVVLSNQDTLRGEILYGGWLKTPTKITFKQNSNTQKYNVKDLQGFYVDDAKEYYQSYVGNIDQTANEPSYMLKFGSHVSFLKSENRFKADTIFLRSLLVSTEITLYTYTDAINKTHFFIKSGNKGIQELVYQKYILENNLGTNLKKHEEYKTLLATTLDKCPIIKNKIENTPYTEKSIVKLIQTYLVCINAPSSYEYNTENDADKASFGIIAGLNLNMLKIIEFSVLPSTKYKYNMGLYPIIGIYANAPLGRNYGRWNLFSDLTLRRISHTIQVSSNDYADNIRAAHLKLVGGVKRKFNVQGKIKPFVSLGGSFLGMLSRSNKIVKYDNGNAWFPLALGVNAGIGIQNEKIAVEIRAERFSDFSNYLYKNLLSSNIGVLVHYRLSK